MPLPKTLDIVLPVLWERIEVDLDPQQEHWPISKSWFLKTLRSTGTVRSPSVQNRLWEELGNSIYGHFNGDESKIFLHIPSVRHSMAKRTSARPGCNTHITHTYTHNTPNDGRVLP